MDALLPDGLIENVVRVSSRQLLTLSLQHVYVFVLVLIRLSGLMSTAPIFGQAVVPVRIRVMIVLAASLMLTPVVQRSGTLAAGRFDADRDGCLSVAETPAHLEPRVLSAIERYQLPSDRPVPLSALSTGFRMETSLSELLRDVLAEFSLGFLLGLGVLVLMSGLQLAGQVIDQQLGLEFGSVVNPDLPQGTAVSGQLLFMAGGCLLLTMTPVNGHLRMLGALIETFDAMPVGEAIFLQNAGLFVTELIHKSMLLAVQVAAPVLAGMSLVSLALGYLGHSVPQINQMVVGFPVRSFAGLLIMAASFTSSMRVVIDAVPDAILEIQQTLLAA